MSIFRKKVLNANIGYVKANSEKLSSDIAPETVEFISLNLLLEL
jgi:hypothetical protein